MVMHVFYVSLLTLFKAASIMCSFNLEVILQEEDLLLKSLNNYRYLEMELTGEFFIKNSSINIGFTNNRTREILRHILRLLLKL